MATTVNPSIGSPPATQQQQRNLGRDIVEIPKGSKASFGGLQQKIAAGKVPGITQEGAGSQPYAEVYEQVSLSNPVKYGDTRPPTMELISKPVIVQRLSDQPITQQLTSQPTLIQRFARDIVNPLVAPFEHAQTVTLSKPAFSSFDATPQALGNVPYQPTGNYYQSFDPNQVTGIQFGKPVPLTFTTAHRIGTQVQDLGQGVIARSTISPSQVDQALSTRNLFGRAVDTISGQILPITQGNIVGYDTQTGRVTFTQPSKLSDKAFDLLSTEGKKEYLANQQAFREQGQRLGGTGYYELTPEITRINVEKLAAEQNPNLPFAGQVGAGLFLGGADLANIVLAPSESLQIVPKVLIEGVGTTASNAVFGAEDIIARGTATERARLAGQFLIPEVGAPIIKPLLVTKGPIDVLADVKAAKIGEDTTVLKGTVTGKTFVETPFKKTEVSISGEIGGIQKAIKDDLLVSSIGQEKAIVDITQSTKSKLFPRSEATVTGDTKIVDSKSTTIKTPEELRAQEETAEDFNTRMAFFDGQGEGTSNVRLPKVIPELEGSETVKPGPQTRREFEQQRIDVLSNDLGIIRKTFANPLQEGSIFIGSLDRLEPQVAPAIKRLNELGYRTTSSGFSKYIDTPSMANKAFDQRFIQEFGKGGTHQIDGYLGLTPEQITQIEKSGVGLVREMEGGYQSIVVPSNKNLGIVKERFNKIVNIIEETKPSRVVGKVDIISGIRVPEQLEKANPTITSSLVKGFKPLTKDVKAIVEEQKVGTTGVVKEAYKGPLYEEITYPSGDKIFKTDATPVRENSITRLIGDRAINVEIARQVEPSLKSKILGTDMTASEIGKGTPTKQVFKSTTIVEEVSPEKIIADFKKPEDVFKIEKVERKVVDFETGKVSSETKPLEQKLDTKNIVSSTANKVGQELKNIQDELSVATRGETNAAIGTSVALTPKESIIAKDVTPTQATLPSTPLMDQTLSIPITQQNVRVTQPREEVRIIRREPIQQVTSRFESFKGIVTDVPTQITTPTQATRQIGFQQPAFQQISRQVQRSGETQIFSNDELQKRIQREAQIQRQSFRQVQKQEQIQKLLEKEVAKVEPIVEPLVKLPFFTSTKKAATKIPASEGFTTRIRRGGKIVDLDTNLSEKEAKKLGAEVVETTAARSFEIVSTGKIAEKAIVDYDFNPNKYQAAKSSKLAGFLVQKAKYAISSMGEKAEITKKGIEAIRRKKLR